MPAYLLITIAGRTVRRELAEGSLRIGGNAASDVVVPGAGPVSVTLVVAPSGARVKASPGALVVNGAPAEAGRLASGDRLQVGDASLVYREESSALQVRVTREVRPDALDERPAPVASDERELQRRFGLLLQLASTIGSTISYAEVLERIMDGVFAALSPERALLALVEPAGELRFEVARHATQRDPWNDMQVSGSILGRVIRSAEAFLAVDATSAVGPDAPSIAQKGIRAALCVPLYLRGRVAGALYADHRGMSGQFSERDLDFLIMLSHLASVALQNVLDYRAVSVENQQLRRAGGTEELLIGDSPPMARLREQIAKVARSELPLLVLGERGTGKELVARDVHRQRGVGPFVAVNCAAIPATLVESALFGHEKGAFTGADRRHAGYFEQADGGTILLDEIGDLGPAAQAALLRALQEGEIQRVGASSPLRVQVRVIAATNRDLGQAVASGRFRGDLFDRLNVLQLEVPPLRERIADLPLLAARFAGERVHQISARALQDLSSYSWPGNVRELRNVIERAVVMGDGETIWPEDLPPQVRRATRGHHVLATLEAVERDHVVRVLRAAEGNISRASEILGIGRLTIYKKLRAYGLEPADFKRASPSA